MTNKLLKCTVIGTYPKPDYVPVPDWFAHTTDAAPTRFYTEFQKQLPDDIQDRLDRGTREAVEQQCSIGIDIPTDGEIRRENFIHYHCRHLNGIDFERLSKKESTGDCFPTIDGPIKPTEHFLTEDYKCAMQYTDKPIKVTIPGPMTIADNLVNEHYTDIQELLQDIATALNYEILALVDAGCSHIQVNYVCIEDAHRRNDDQLWSLFVRARPVIGVIDVARSRVESVEEIKEHIAHVLGLLAQPQFAIVAPDCGLGLLPATVAQQKLTNMVKAAKMLRK